MTQGFTSQYTPTILTGSGAPTVTPSFIGQTYLDTTAKRKYEAFGISSSADWIKVPVYYSGTVTVTGGGGDVTVTLPWDWTGGFLNLIISVASDSWCLHSYANAVSKIETSYDALTNSAYTIGQLYYFNPNGTSPSFGANSKTTNYRGYPKTATTTSFTLDDDGTTCYIKYFVWA